MTTTPSFSPSRLRALTGALLAASALGALAAPAADAAPKLKTATFSVDLKGSQVTTWEYHRDTLKDDRCGSKIDGYGDQTIRFGPGPKGRLVVMRQGGKKPVVAAVGSNSNAALWSVLAKAERSGTWIVDVGSNREGCGGADGGGTPGRRDKDCGTRYGWVRPDLALTGGRAVLSGDSLDWADHVLKAIETGDMLDDLYEDCPFWTGGPYVPESDGGLLPAPEKLPLKRVFDKKRKKIVVHFGHTKTYVNGAFSGKTVVAGKLTLKRIKTPKAGR